MHPHMRTHKHQVINNTSPRVSHLLRKLGSIHFKCLKPSSQFLKVFLHEPPPSLLCHIMVGSVPECSVVKLIRVPAPLKSFSCQRTCCSPVSLNLALYFLVPFHQEAKKLPVPAPSIHTTVRNQSTTPHPANTDLGICHF